MLPDIKPVGQGGVALLLENVESTDFNTDSTSSKPRHAIRSDRDSLFAQICRGVFQTWALSRESRFLSVLLGG